MCSKTRSIVLILQFVIFCAPAIAFASQANETESCTKPIELRYQKRVGSFLVRVSHANDRTCQRLEILKRKKVVYREEGFNHHYYLGVDGNQKNYMRKLTGHGSQLIILNSTLGTRCCRSLLIFDLKPGFKKLAEIESGGFDPEIADINNDGIAEIRIMDDFLAELFSSGADSVTADVVLKYAKDQYVIAPEFMKKPPPSKRQLEAKIADIKKLMRKKMEPDWPPKLLIQIMTDLLYSGNRKLAFGFVEHVWPQDVEGKNDFLNRYRQALTWSNYYGEFVRALK